MFEKKITIDISYSTFIKIILIVLLLVFLFLLQDVLLMVFVAIVIAAAINPLVSWLHKRRIPRAISILFIYILFLGFLVLMITLLVPPIASQIRQLSDLLPQYFKEVSGRFVDLEKYDLIQPLQNILKSLGGRLAEAGGGILTTLSSIFGSILSVIVVIVLSFYFALKEEGTKKFIKAIIPKRYQPYVIDLVSRIEFKIGRWLRGQLVLCLSIGILIFVGLSILRVDYALVLALLAGILEIIPIIGPVIAALPAIFLAFMQSPLLAVFVIVLYLVVQQLENHILAPKIMQKAVGLDPIVIILVLLIGGKLAGILGVILAVPVATAISVFIHDIFEERGLGVEENKK